MNSGFKYLYYTIFFLFCTFSLFARQNDTLLKQAENCQYLGDYDSANYYLSKAFDYNMSDIQQFNIRYKILNNHIRLGNLDTALKQADSLNTFVEQRLSTNKLAEGSLLNSIGFLFLSKGLLNKANDNLARAFTLLMQAGDKVQLSNCYNDRGVYYWNTGNLELAKEYLDQALIVRLEIYGENHPETAAIYNNLGLINSDIPDQAITFYLKAYQIYKNIFTQAHPSHAISQVNLGIVYLKQKKYKDSEVSFLNALDINRIIYGDKHARVAFCYFNLARLYFLKEEMSLADSWLNDAFNIYSALYGEKHPEIANIYNFRGEINLKKKDYMNALLNFQDAINANSPGFNNKDYYKNPSFTDYYHPDIFLSSLLSKSRALEDLYFSKTLKYNQLLSALNTLSVCDSLIGQIRGLRTNKNDKIALGNIASEVYSDAVRITLALADVSTKPKYWQKKAFYFSERNKSAVLMEAISELKARDFAGIPREQTFIEEQFNADIAYYTLKLAEKPEKEIEDNYRIKLFETNQNYLKFISELEVQYPAYFALKYKNSIAEPGQFKNLSKDVAIISYFTNLDALRLTIFIITRKGLIVQDVPLVKSFEKKLQGFRNAIVYRDDEFISDIGNQLYKQLVPVLPKHVKNLIIIPDGKAGAIPFEVLCLKNNYLIERYNISYAFSASLLNEKKEGNPVSTKAFMCAPILFPVEFNELPATETEIRQLCETFESKGIKTEFSIFGEATEFEIKNKILDQYSFLHFATHGEVNEENPDLSRIILSGPGGTDEDGFLYAGEIFNLNLKAKLVALSACQTGLGKISRGEGMIGLSRALLYAGADNLLVSFWKVSDNSTAVLMQDFYKDYLNDDQGTFSKSLRKAKLKMLQDPKYKSPYYWAPFVLISSEI